MAGAGLSKKKLVAIMFGRRFEDVYRDTYNKSKNEQHFQLNLTTTSFYFGNDKKKCNKKEVSKKRISSRSLARYGVTTKLSCIAIVGPAFVKIFLFFWYFSWKLVYLVSVFTSLTRFGSHADCEGFSFASSWNFDVGRLVVLRLLLLAVGLAEKGWIVALPELEQAVEPINNNHAVDVDEQHHGGDDAVAHCVLTGHLPEEPRAERNVNENVEYCEHQVGYQAVLLLLKSACNQQYACHQVQKVDRGECRQED